MIQRIQTIFLLLTAILMAVTVFSPLAQLVNIDTGESAFFKCAGIFKENEVSMYFTWGVISMAVLSALLAFINIFIFKKRKCQAKLCNLTTITILLFYAAFASYYYCEAPLLNLKFAKAEYGIILPVIALIFNFLAKSRIKTDEKLVQSLNRIR